jgi:hypothetical protein
LEREFIRRDAGGMAQQGPQHRVTNNEATGVTFKSERVRSAALFGG